MPLNFKKIYLFLRARQKIILGVIFVLLLLLNALIFYQYVYLAVESQPELKLEQVAVNQEILGEILANIEERQKSLSQALKTQYPDLFR